MDRQRQPAWLPARLTRQPSPARYQRCEQCCGYSSLQCCHLAGGRVIASCHDRIAAVRVFPGRPHNTMAQASLLDADSGLPRGVYGAADPRFANVVRIFAGLFPGRRFGGGTLAVYIEGRPVVDVGTGRGPWGGDTGAMVFSATKGVASTVIHRLVDRELLCYDTPVADYWPEFGANGKADITVRDVLRHRSGLSHLKGVTKTELMDHHLMEERLAAAPVDHLRGAPAYHALTYG